MKEYKNSTGIYKITNINNGKIYIGCTNRTFKIRWRVHLYNLKGNRHCNKDLQDDYNKGHKFDFKILSVTKNGKKYENDLINIYRDKIGSHMMYNRDFSKKSDTYYKRIIKINREHVSAVTKKAWKNNPYIGNSNGGITQELPDGTKIFHRNIRECAEYNDISAGSVARYCRGERKPRGSNNSLKGNKFYYNNKKPG